MAQKPSIPKGTRDFGPAEMVGRNYIFNIVRSVFRKYGYQCIETPSMENLSTLLGKYGEEGDKLLFRIQNSGEKAALAPEKGLRYDLTVPFARFVVQHQNEIAFPFKRYQIQPVWRADRPQKGRYREFYQCDVDVIGSKSLLNELELVQMVDDVFGQMGIRVVIKLNNRKILAGLAEVSGQPDKLVDITVAIDKIDKIGLDAVKQELTEKGLTEQAIAVIEPVLTLSGTTAEKLARMRELLAASDSLCKAAKAARGRGVRIAAIGQDAQRRIVGKVAHQAGGTVQIQQRLVVAEGQRHDAQSLLCKPPVPFAQRRAHAVRAVIRGAKQPRRFETRQRRRAVQDDRFFRHKRSFRLAVANLM